MDITEKKIILLSTLIQLESRARHAQSLNELGFIITNESLRLIDYRQSVLWRISTAGRITVDAVSGVDKADGNSPFVRFIKRVVRHFIKKTDHQKVSMLEKDDLNERDKNEWRSFSLESVLWCPLITPDNQMVGGILMTREKPFIQGEIALAEKLADAYAYSCQALDRQKRTLAFLRSPSRVRSLFQVAMILLLIGLMFMPVRLSALAPVEIVPDDPRIVSVPMEGVISHFNVNPNQTVHGGQSLFCLDDTGIRNENEVSKKTLDVVKAEYRRAIQKGFTDETSRADRLLLKAQIDQKTAEVTYMAELLKRSCVKADQDGIIIFLDKNDWIGKPVAVGEKVASIADPEKIQAQILLPVEDAINLEPGAEILIFLNVEPDRPLSAVLRKASYEASLTPEGIMAFRLKADIIKENRLPRIGLRGTAKIYGKQVSLLYYLVRRPLSSARQLLGV